MAGNKRKAGKYESGQAKAYQQVSGTPKKSGKKIFSKILIVLVIVCFVAAGGLGAYLYFFSGVTPGLILNNVTVLDVHIGGMTKEEAMTALQTAFNQEYCANMMKVTVLDQSIEISAAEAGLTLNVEGAVEEAYSLGRTGNQANRKLQQMQALAGVVNVDITPYLTMDNAALKQSVDELVARFESAPVDGHWEILGDSPDLTTEEPPEGAQTLVVYMGTPGYDIDADKLLEMVQESYRNNTFTVKGNSKTLKPAVVDLQSVYDEVCTAPVEALMDKETFEVMTHAYGYNFDLNAAKALQAKAADGESFEVPFSFIAPASTKLALESILFRDVLGTYTAYSASDPSNRDVNLKLSCQAINDTVLMPGEIFSYNPALGKRTPEAGWKEADGYVGNETVKEYGGGICQASSCLYLSALLADLEIVERVNHGFISAYMPYGMDATVSWGGPEFRFKNTTEYPLRIEAWSSGGAVTVRLVGTDTKDYYVKMTYEILNTDPFETVEEEFEPDNEKGYQDGDVVTSGYTGYKIRTYRCKYDKETKELISREVEATSTYDRRDKVICKIKTETPEDPSTDPSDTTDPTVPSNPSDPTEPPTDGPVIEPSEPPSEDPTDNTTESGTGGTVTEDG